MMTRTKKTRQGTTSANKEGRKAAVNLELSKLPLAGEVVTFRPRPSGTYTHAEVIAALTAAGLDKEAAKEFRNKKAFGRVIKQMEENREIDEVHNAGTGIITFQLTKKLVEDDSDDGELQMTFKKETKLYLDVYTGKVRCKHKDIEAQAQTLLDKAKDTRTSADITEIVQSLFESAGGAFPDIFRIREQGGAYFVPIHLRNFVDQIQDFLEYRLGGKLGRWPIPKGTVNGDAAIADSVSAGMEQRLKEFEAAVDKWTINTRPDTLEEMTNNVNEARVKLQAYDLLLADNRATVAKEIDRINKMLVAKISALDVERENAPPRTNTSGGKYDILGHASTRVIHWLAANDYSFEDTQKVLAHFKITNITDANMRYRYGRGRQPAHSNPADLTPEQVKEIKKIIKGK